MKRMKSLFQDIRYGVRVLARAPGFTLVAVLSLALGIAANTSIFSVVYAVLLRPLPFAEPSQLIGVDNGGHLIRTFTESPADFLATDYETTSFESLAAYDNEGSVNLTEVGEAERILTTRVSTNFFPTLGVNPMLGRNFLTTEGKVGADRVVILGHGLWQRRFNANRDAIGKMVKLNGQSFSVIGVMPEGFEFPQYNGKAEMFVPLIWRDDLIAKEGIFIQVIGRLKSGITLERAQAEMNTITQRIELQEGYKVDPIRLTLLSREFSKHVGAALWILLGAVGFVLMISCANVAGLLLERAASRQQELAVRSAVGASRARLVRQLLTESIVLASLGGGVGVLLSWLSLNALVSISPVQISPIHTIEINPAVMLFTLGASLVTGVVFGLAPSLQFSKPDLNDLLKQGGKGLTARGSRVQQLLIISELAIALVLLVSATLMLKTFRNFISLDKGFDSSGVLTLEISPPKTKYKDKKQQADFYQRIIENIRDVPGVLSVGGANHIPLASKQGRMIVPLYVEGRQSGDQWPASGDYRVISPDYFRAMGITLLKGRAFQNQDDQKSQRVVVVNEAVARQLFPGEDPIGKRLIIFDAKDKPYEIIGVVADTRNWGLAEKPMPEFYLSYQQSAPPFLGLAVRTKDDPRRLIEEIRHAVAAIDPDQPLYNVITMEQALSDSISKERFAMFMLGLFAAMAFILAIGGIYGVMSYSVTQRTHEIGVRVALGAREPQVVRMILRQGIILIVIGLTIGLASSFALTRVLAGLLYGVNPADPAVFSLAALLLGLVALFACYVPARRASRVNPMEALRYE
jgi:putative ABC transport system permease protein